MQSPDRRDQRDPTVIGEGILQLVAQGWKATAAADELLSGAYDLRPPDEARDARERALLDGRPETSA